MCSSTRAEIAGVIGALTDTEAIHIGIDNQGALSNVNKLISKAASYQKKASDSPNWKPPTYPLGKAWGLIPDGDMLEATWKAILARGPHAQRLKKVKGHATFEDVEEGRATTEERLGNDEADRCATLGIQEATPGSLRRIACWLLRRQTLYGHWLADVNKIIVAVLRAEKVQREARRKAHKTTHGYYPVLK